MPWLSKSLLLVLGVMPLKPCFCRHFTALLPDVSAACSQPFLKLLLTLLLRQRGGDIGQQGRLLRRWPSPAMASAMVGGPGIQASQNWPSR